VPPEDRPRDDVIGEQDPNEGGAALQDALFTDTALNSALQWEEDDVSADRKFMTLDEVTLSNLEVLVNSHDRTAHCSLWAFVNRTRTPFGRRLLRNWLCHPLYRPKGDLTYFDLSSDLIYTDLNYI